ncbi:MAG: SusC/RagA family TonB-linked outer membrane protein [Flavisolibacter sp.]
MRKILFLLSGLLLFSIFSYCQTKQVTGRVTDEKGEALPFATVREVGTKNATSADQNGFFSIKMVKNSLLISALGHKEQTIEVTGNTANVSLSTQNSQLSEVVITTAFGVRRQAKELGYATAKINTAELNQARVTNIASGLSGKVSGLQIMTTSAGVNPQTRITLRGNRSILGNNQALLVVDDIPLPITYLNSINPNDVDNTTILKGASASALYGSAASNGVLIVTTKKGNRGGPIIRFSNTTTIEAISYLPKFQNEFGGFGGENIGSPGTQIFPENPFVPYVSYENQSYGPRFNGAKVPLGLPVRFYRKDGTFFDSVAKGIYQAKPNAKRDFFNKGITTQNDISYSTGDEKSRFFLSAQDVTTTGIIPGDKNHRDAFRLAGSRETGRFSTDYSLGYTLTHTNTTPGSGVPSTTGPFAGSALFGGNTGGSYFQSRPVYWTVINTPANYDLRDYKNWRDDPFANPNGYFNAYYGNPWWQIDQTRLDEKASELLGNLSLNFKAFNFLNLTARGSVLRRDYNAKYTRAGFTFADWAIADAYGAGSIPAAVKKLDPQEGDAASSTTRLTGDFLASFNKTINNFSLRVIGGAEVVDNTNNNYFLSSENLVIPDFYNISNRTGQPNVSQSSFHTRNLGAFGDATIGFKDFLYLHGSIRNDWVSILSKSNRSFLYPAVDASFILTDAISSLKNNKVLYFAKLRAAYSKTAQVSISPYSLQNTFNAGPGFPFGVPGFSLSSSFANPDIKPEFTTEKEVGFELGFLNNRINVSGAFYKSLTNNQTIPITISSATGFTQAFVNSGEMENKGMEFDVKIVPVVSLKNGFRWDISGNFSYVDNKLLSIAPNLNQVYVGGNAFAVVGKAYPQLLLTDWLRAPNGKIIVDKNNGLPSPDPTPKAFGTTNPPYKLGLSTTFSFKGLSLIGVAEYRSGAFIYNNIGGDLDFTGVSYNSARYGRQNFVIPNSVYDNNGNKNYVDNTNITVRNGNNEFWASTLPTVQSPYVTSASFWKIREVALVYDFPQRLVTRTRAFKGVSLALVGRNLLMFRPKENIWTDPEFSNTNGNGIGTTDINQTPTTRTYGASLTLTF